MVTFQKDGRKTKNVVVASAVSWQTIKEGAEND